MARDADAPARPPAPARRRRSWGRRIIAVLALVLLAAVAVRVALTVYAADVFVAVLARALAGSGAEVVFAEPPSVSMGGFQARGVVLRSISGEEWVKADEASGSAHLLFQAPYVSVALELKGVRASLASSGAKRKEAGRAVSALDVAVPASLSSIGLEDARVDLGEGREIVFNATIASGDGGSTHVEVARLDYSELSGERAGEKIAGKISLSPAEGAAPKLEVSIRTGAALAGTVFFDFDAHPLRLAAIVEETKERWSFRDVTFSLGKLLRGTGSFALAGGAVASADVQMAVDDLEPAWATLVREPFAGVVPSLAGSELRGRGGLRLEMRAPSRHRATASVTLSLDSLRTRSVESEGLSVEVPWIGAEQSGQGARTGRLRAKRVTLLGLPWSGVDIALDASAGRLRAKSVQEWKSAGGTMRVSGLAYEDNAAKGPRLSGDVELSGFDLAALGNTFGWKGLAGSLGGNLGRVEIDGDAVRASGAVDIEAWRGTVTLSRLSVEDPFGRVPELGLDAVVRDVDLVALTAALGVGSVSGVLEGHVTGLVVADGQPQAFEADLHTVERRGVSQTIDVRAIAQLGVLGGDTGSLTGSLLKMIKRYRYSEMGIRCRLRNDVFEIRGVRTRDGRDYLVKGSLLPPSVSVVSHSQVISFSEMLRRVERIGAIEKVDEGGSPDVQPPQ